MHKIGTSPLDRMERRCLDFCLNSSSSACVLLLSELAKGSELDNGADEVPFAGGEGDPLVPRGCDFLIGIGSW